MHSKFFLVYLLFLHVTSLQGKVINKKVLQLSQLTKCTYDYEVSVYTARGAKSTLSNGYQAHAFVRFSSFTVCFSSDDDLNLARFAYSQLPECIPLLFLIHDLVDTNYLFVRILTLQF